MPTAPIFSETDIKKLIFFKELLSETKIAYENSKISKENFYYSICGTPLNIGDGLIIGINWGVDKEHSAQSEIPDGKDIVTYNFIKRSKELLEQFTNVSFTDINFNYSNLCFFRSRKASDLCIEDYQNSKQLFIKYLKFIKPQWVISLGNTNTKVLSQLSILTNEIEFIDKEQKHKSYKGYILDIPYYSVPHPNARVKSESRNLLWQKVFS